MILHLSRVSLIVFAIASLMATFPAVAGSFTLSPIRLDFAPDHRDTSIALQNEAQAPVSIQARVYSWKIENGEDSYTPTKDILIAPPIMTIGPNALQVVRAAFRIPANAHKELAYRIFFAELPQARESNKRQVDMTLTVGIPVFMAPNALSDPDPPTWSAQIKSQPNGKPMLRLSTENRGNVHFRIDRLQVRAQKQNDAGADRARMLLSYDSSRYVLAGTQRHWEVSLSPDAAGPLEAVELGYTSGDREFLVTVPVMR